MEQLVQDLDRKHPDWSSRQIEAELELLAPVGYGYWRENTANLRARFRQIQRWRRGQASSAGPSPTAPLFHRIWPIGERQRRALDPTFTPGSAVIHASHRAFLRNCAPEPLREVRAKLAGVEVAYEPVLHPQGFLEIRWVRNPAVRQAALEAEDSEVLQHTLDVEFAAERGLRRGHLKGVLSMSASDGWFAFEADDGQRKEIE
ncbi:MAG TPA: hypothetical protein VFF67_01585 [Thermoplasmata archaeon]|nr:hypothetical protein [Thermoplasmata archaeon]